MHLYSVLLIILCFFFSLLTTPYASLATDQNDITQKIAEARTAADYAAIATYYEQQAQAARQRQQRYEAERVVAEKRQSGPRKQSGAVALHIASSTHAEREAKEYEALAELYREKERNTP